jgi:hypothetical protein
MLQPSTFVPKFFVFPVSSIPEFAQLHSFHQFNLDSTNSFVFLELSGSTNVFFVFNNIPASNEVKKEFFCFLSRRDSGGSRGRDTSPGRPDCAMAS